MKVTAHLLVWNGCECSASERLGLDDAIEKVCRSTVFTTHTPVPAGHDRFDIDLVRSQLEPLQRSLEMDMDRLLGLGRVHPEDPDETFCMTVWRRASVNASMA